MSDGTLQAKHGEVDSSSGSFCQIATLKNWRRIAADEVSFGILQSSCILWFWSWWVIVRNLYPRHSMYAIYAHIGVVLGVNVGIYMVYMECLSILLPNHFV